MDEPKYALHEMCHLANYFASGVDHLIALLFPLQPLHSLLVHLGLQHLISLLLGLSLSLLFDGSNSFL